MTDGRTGMDNAKKKINGEYESPNDEYSSIPGPGSSSLQDRSMNKSNIRPHLITIVDKGHIQGNRMSLLSS